MKFSEAAKKVISVVAPGLATALSGPLAGAAASEIVRKLGGDIQHAEATIASGSPEVFLQLRQAEIDFQKFLKDNEIDLEKAHQEDRNSARLREISVKDTTPQILAYLYLLTFLVVLTMQFWVIIQAIEVREGALRILDGMTGILGTLVTGSKDYYFGSSASSKQKTGMLAK